VRLAALRTTRRLRRGWRVSTVVSCSSHPLLKLAELGGVSVLRPVGELFIAQAGDPQPGVEFFEGSGDAGEVLSLRLHQTVGVLGGPGSPVGPGGVSTDDQVLDAMAIEDLDDAGEVRLGGR